MENDAKTLKENFEKIRQMGWIKYDGTNYGMIGITFEKLLGLSTNEFEIPDFGEIEIKTKSKSKFDYVSLFNCVPTGPHFHEIERIKNLYGYPDKQLKEFKVFNGDVVCNKLGKIGIHFYFILNMHRDERKIKLCVFDKNLNKIEETTFWDFDILEEKLNRKLKYLALVKSEKRINNGSLFFRYNSIIFYKLKSFDVFTTLLEQGIIKITFKISVFKSGKRLGQIHDRGTAFSISEQNIEKLFDLIK